MNRSLLLALCIVTTAGLPATAGAGRSGKADLTLWQQTTETSTPTVKVGDQLRVEAFIRGNGEQFTQATLFFTFDDRYLELVPVSTRVQNGQTIITAFTAGNFLRGSQLFNDTLGDQIGGPYNQIPNFQVRYSEYIPKFQGAPQRVAVGNGVVARFSLRVIRKPSNGTTRITVNRISPSGGETGYFINGDPGNVYNYRNLQEMTVTVEGLKLTSLIPDLYIRPDTIDTSLDHLKASS